MLDAVRLVLGTLTVLPVAPPSRVDRAVAARAMLLAPLAALPAALAVAAAGALHALISLPAALAAALAVTAVTLSARAMHLDGLADTADGLSAGYERARSLEVMRTGTIGPSGVAAVVLVLAVDVAALTTLLATGAGTALAALAVLLSRHLLAWACVRGIPAARAGGLGAAVAGSVGRVALAAVAVLVGVASTVVAVAAGQAWWAGLVMAGGALAAGAEIVRRAVRRLGGVTGDVLGAVVEVGMAAALTVAAVVVTAR